MTHLCMQMHIKLGLEAHSAEKRALCCSLRQHSLPSGTEPPRVDSFVQSDAHAILLGELCIHILSQQTLYAATGDAEVQS